MSGRDFGVDRRAAIGAIAGAALAPAFRADAADALAIGSAMLERSRAWFELASPELRDAASFAFEGGARRNWNFMRGSRTAPGARLEQMDAAQREAALALLATGLSESGYRTAERIMLQQDILRDEWGKGAPDRNSKRFSLQFYGAPSAEAPWTWRFEGHHLSLSYTLIGEEVISVTPSAFSSEPNPVPSGPHEGLLVLDFEQRGRALFGDMDQNKRRAALLRETSFGNILATAGREDRVGAPAGLPLADMSASERDRARALLYAYAVDHLPASLAAIEVERLNGGDPLAARFGWAGDDRSGGSIYFRLHGDDFLIEFATLRNQPLHHHAVRHDFARNFGDHAIDV